jgi:hypothetical protein
MVGKWIKRIAVFLAIIIFLIAGLLLFLHTSAGKSIVRKKVESYLRQKWKTEVQIGNIDYRLPNWIALENVLILDRQKDTLLSGRRLYVAIQLLKLLSNTVDVRGVRLEAITLQCHREKEDSAFNFQFIFDAFKSAPKANPEQASGPPMQLSVSKLSLDDVRFYLRDKKEKFYFSASIDSFSCFPSELKLEKTTYNIHRILLRNSKVTIIDSSSAATNIAKEDTKSRGDPARVLITLDKMQLQNIQFSYQRPARKNDFSIQLDSLQLNQTVLDLGRQSVNASSIRLSNTAVNFLTWVPLHTPSKENKPGSPSAHKKEWQIRVDTVTLRNNSFVYHNAAVPPTKGLDFQHLNVQGISLETRQSTFDSSGLFTKLNHISLQVNNLIDLKRLTAVVRLTHNQLNVKDLTLALNQSQLSTRGDIVWELNPGSHRRLPPKLVITNSSINYGDLLRLQPALKKSLPISLSTSENILMSGIFSGALQDLTAKAFSLSTSGRQFQFKGNLDLKIGKAGPIYTATIHQLHLKKQLLSKDLLQQLEKEKILLPLEIDVTGQIQGNAEKLQTDLKLTSSFGQLHVKGVAKNINRPQRMIYDVQLNANQLETGKWIGLDSLLGKITGQIHIKGAGTEKNKLAAGIRWQLQSAMINGYPFSNIDMEGQYSGSEFTIRSSINDPNLQAEMNLKGRIGSGPAVKGNIQIGKADLTQLGLTPDTIAFASNISIDADYTHPPKLQALLQADSNTIMIRGKKIFTDSLSFICNADKDSSLILVNAPIISATLKSNYGINELPSEISSIWQAIYPSHHSALQNQIPSVGQNHYTGLTITLAQTEVLRSFVPQLELLEPLTIRGRYDATKKDSSFFVQLTAPGIRYDNYEVHELHFQAESADTTIQYALSGSEVRIGTRLLTNASITGRLQKDLVFIKARVDDERGKEYYSGHMAIQTGKTETTIRILDDVTFNYNKWKVSADNWVRILRGGYIINHLLLENRGQRLYVHSTDPQTLSPIAIRIDSFDIGNILALLSKNDTLLAGGTLNASFNLQQPISKIPILTGDIHATNLAVFNIPVGEFNFHSATSGDSLVLQGGLSGFNRVNFDGSIHLNSRKVNIQTRLQKIDMNLIQELTKDIFSRLSGQITGELQLKGSPDSPHIRGTIDLDSLAFALKDLNALYRIDKQKLVIDYPELRLGQFILSDTAGHQLSIQGKIQVLNPGELGLDINIDTKNFVALNAPRRLGSPIYGTGIIDAQVSIKGTSTEPVIEGNAYLHEKSNVHFLLTAGSSFNQNRKTGIVFVNIDTLKTSAEAPAEPEKDTLTARKTFKGLKYNLNLRVNKDAEFSVIIDPTTNDELVIKGEGRLNAGLQENGIMGITGVYQLQSGYYKMNNLLLRGKFMLVKGSTISFNGDPMSAVADVTTEYEIQTTAKGLLEYRENDDPDYSQRLPFLVVLMLKGPVSKPDISFDIKLKEGKAGLKSSVKADIEHALDRLRNDVTAMNKQVFSLLLTKRFSGSGGGTDLASSNLNANNALQEGVSSFLTEAMNQVADQLIKGVDIDVNMKSYKSGDDPVSKTDLGVAMSKELLENRLIIRVEENFAVGGEGSTAPKSGTQYIPDVTSTYKLSKDGRYQVKAYQKNEYDAVVQGYFTEVGVSFTIELTYDKFKEIFQRKKQSPGEEK